MKDVENLNVAVYGAGAMGTVLGVLLTVGGLKNVSLITRNAAHVNALKKNGATVFCRADDKKIVVPVTALHPHEMQGEYDVVFLMTKQRDNAAIVTGLLPFLHENSVVCTTQNGFPEPSVAAIVGAERTYGAATSFGANFLGEGKAELTSRLKAASMEVGGYRNSGEKTSLLCEILSYAGRATGNADFVKTTENLSGARWSKLAVNAAFSTLSTLTGLTFGEVAKKPKTRKIALGMLRETIAVAKASGVTLAKMQGHDLEKTLGGKTLFKRFVAYMVLPFAIKKHKKLRSGMLIDIQNGKKCEIDFVCGVVCREGAKVGVKTPLCERAVEMIHGVENGLYEIDYKNVDFFQS